MGGFIMDINYILENEELKKYLSDSIGKTYHRFKLYKAVEFEDFSQDCYIEVLKKIRLFEETKSNIKSYITLIVMSMAKMEIKKATGKIKIDGKNKLEIKLNTLSFDYSYSEDEENSNNAFESIIGNNVDYDNKILIEEIMKMNNLSNFQKDIFKLFYKGYNCREIGKILDRDINTVYKSFYSMKNKILRKYSA
jgi:RNA polymerase sigma factor (sigma-70 family)